MRRKTYNIRCSECRKLIFNYVKYGDGNLINCHKNRILDDNSVKEGKDVRCDCGKLVGIDIGDRFKMKPRSFVVE
ncbi:MAG: hypothetical protein ACOC53_01595 [Candidatus Saliniplasma sp.]